ncbi:MAG: TolC family protein [bacterium]
MKNTYRIILTLFLFAGLSTPKLPAQQSQAKIFTLEEAVRIAMQKNPDLISARLEVDRADARVSEAIGTALPSITLAGQYSHAFKKPVFFLPNFFADRPNEIVAIEMGTKHSINSSLTVSQILFNAAVITGVGVAKIYSGAARELLRAKEVETVAKTRKAFYGALMTKEVVQMMRQTLKNAEDNLRNVQVMGKQGIVSEYDQLRAEVGIANLRPMILQAENNYALALDGLRNTIGLGVNDQVDIAGMLKFEPVDPLLLEGATEKVLEANYGLRAMRMNLEISDAVVSINKSEYYPTLAAFGNYQYQLAKNSFNISPNDFIASSSVGLSLSINLFNGLQTSSRVEQAKLELQKAHEQFNGMEKNIRTGTHSVLLQLKQAHQRYEAQGMTVEQAQRGYKIATTRFTSGVGTQLEVNDAQLALTQAQVNRIQAIFDYLNAAADFDQLLSRLPLYATSTN